MLLDLVEAKGAPLSLSEILAALMERYSDRIQPRSKPTARATAHQAHRKLLNRFNRAIRQSKRNGRQNLSKLLQQRNQVIQHMRYDLHQKQRIINDAHFQKDKYGAYNKVINPQDPTSPEGSKEDAETFLRSEFSAYENPNEPFSIPTHTPSASSAMDAILITGDDVARALTGKASNAAPGYDGMTYGVLRCLGPQGRRMLAEIFQEILEGKTDIPRAWTTIRVRMVYKGKRKDVKLWSSFRAVSIGSTVAKILHAIFETKMLAHLRQHNIIDESIQKGFLRNVSGTTDHIQVINHLAQHIPSNGELHMVLLDLKSAFNSVPHHKLWAVMEHYRIDKSLIDYFKKLYSQTTMHIKTKDFTTKDVPVGRGVLQGCTVSPLLFVMFFMLVINSAKATAGPGFEAPIDGSDTATLIKHILKAFADDLTLIDSSLEGVKKTWEGVQAGLKLAGLTVNQDKCCHIVLSRGGKVRRASYHGETVTLGPDMVIPTGAEAASPFLGCDRVLAPSVRRLKKALRCQLLNTLKIIDEANYSPKAKIFFYRIAVISKMRWYFMIYEAISLTTVESLNTLATQYIKKWLGTSPKATPEFLTNSERGLGITPLTDVWSRGRMVHMVNGLRSKDPSVVGACHYRATHPTKFNKDDIQITQSLVNEHPIPNKLAINARVLHRTNEKDKDRITKEVKSAAWVWAISDEHSLRAWKDLLDHNLHKGSIGSTLALVSGGPSFWSWTYTQDRIRNNYGRLTQGTDCIFCGLPSQKVSHFLNFCNHEESVNRYTHRHNKVVSTILEHILGYARLPEVRNVWADLDGGPASVGDVIEGWQSDRKPDIVIEWLDSKKRARISIIEVTCPYEHADMKHLNSRHAEKHTKYADLVTDLNNCNRKPYRVKASLHVLVVGARGYVHPEFFSSSFTQLFHEEEKRDKQIRLLARECASASLQGSLDIIRSRDKPNFPYRTPRYPWGLVQDARTIPATNPSSLPPSPSNTPPQRGRSSTSSRTPLRSPSPRSSLSTRSGSSSTSSSSQSSSTSSLTTSTTTSSSSDTSTSSDETVPNLRATNRTTPRRPTAPLPPTPPIVRNQRAPKAPRKPPTSRGKAIHPPRR